MPPILILAATRTPIGSFQGVLSGVSAPRLGAAAIRGALGNGAVPPEEVSDVWMGSVLQAGQGQAPARQAAIYAGIPPAARCVTLHKVCGSGMEAVIQGVRAIALQEATVVVAGGMESMSAAPYLLPGARRGYRLGHQPMVDSILCDGLWDPYNDLHMGACAEKCAARFGFTREEQDGYAAESFVRANAAQAAGRFRAEITAVEISGAKGQGTRIDADEGPAKVNYEKIPLLKPVFEQGGTITAANASSLNDGAAALVLAAAGEAAARGLTGIARIISYASHSAEPVWFTTAPIVAAQTALTKAGWTSGDVDLWEVNEAFAVVPLAFARELQVSRQKLNVNGGAISLGHPIGASGARILVTLIAALRDRQLRRGVAAICIGGGEGLAMCVELI